MNKKIKDNLKKSIDYLNRLFVLNKVNNYEKSGRLKFFSKIKFIPKTTLNVPFSLGRTIRGLSFDSCFTKDPFGVFIKRILKNKNELDSINYLFSLYKKESKLNASDLLGFKNNFKLSKFPAWSLVMPWDQITIEEKNRLYEDQLIKSRLIFFDQKKIYKNKKNFFYSIDNAKSQLIQSKNLINSIKEKGMLKSLSLPKIIILIDGNEWRWCMSGQGNHRSYISYGLNNFFFECEIESVINKKNLNMLRNVQNKLFSLSEAEEIFDLFFTGKKCLRGIT